MEEIRDIGCNNTTKFEGNYFKGNIIPNDWYKKIITNSGRPDLSSITILAEIVYWYRPSKDGNKKFKDDAWQTSYEYFENKFCYNRQKIRRTFVRLENLGLIRRELRIVKYYGQKYGNVLFIRLLDESLLGLDKEKDKNFSSSEIKNNKPLLQNCSNNIDIENKKEKNRSNFFNLRNKNLTCLKPKNLKDFYPLSESDVQILNKISGRDFTTKAANEIFLSITKKLPSHKFYTYKSFLNYMVKVFSNELRQAEIINNSSFRINSNKNIQEKKLDQIEKTLDLIENSKDTSQISILKKRLIGALEPSKAYNIIESLKNFDYRNGLAKIHLNYILDLSIDEENRILREVRIIVDNDAAKLKFIILDDKVKSENMSLGSANQQPKIWENIRKKAINIFGKEIDQSWFSRLNPVIDKEKKSICIRADTEFIRDWVEVNYKSFLVSQINMEGFTLDIIY